MNIREGSKLSVGDERVVRNFEPMTIAKWKKATILMSIGFGLGWIGPFNTYLSIHPIERIIYWICSIFISFGLWSLLVATIEKPFSKHGIFIRKLIVAVPFSIINSAIIAASIIRCLTGLPIASQKRGG